MGSEKPCHARLRASKLRPGMLQLLLSVPPRLHGYLASPAGRAFRDRRLPEVAGSPVFVGTDPVSRRLGSGGGTVHLLHQAWRAEPARLRGPDPIAWIERGQRLVLHAGGESRRLPAYAALSKVFLPMPAITGLSPRRFDQVLLDFQVPTYRQALAEAGPRAAVLVTAGDVWLDFDPLEIPPVGADITGIGMRVAAEVARGFGVYFVRKSDDRGGARSRPIAFFRQKPSPEEIHGESAACDFYVDTGMWLLSARALKLLFRRCGWDGRRRRFATPDGHPRNLDLYTEIGAALGSESRPSAGLRRLGWSRLTTAVIPLETAHFHHLGSNRQLFESFSLIQRGDPAPQTAFRVATPPGSVAAVGSLPTWADRVSSRSPVSLAGHNLLTGLPAGSNLRRLEVGWCAEAAPVGRGKWVFRPYHLDDTLRGRPGAGGRICGQDARSWLAARKLSSRAADVFDLPLYPVLPAAGIDQDLLAWFFSASPDPEVGARLSRLPLLSARQIPDRIDFGRLFARQRAAQAEALRADFQAWQRSGDAGIFSQDFGAIADFCRSGAGGLGRWLRSHGPSLAARAPRAEHAARMLHLAAELSPPAEAGRIRLAGLGRLQRSLLATRDLEPARPRTALKDDQIVWARSPVRLDLAGGWTDTPPYCLEHGGAVLNVAVLLNGQPPIQVFVRPIAEPLFRLRSIDLGAAEEVETFAALAAFRDPGSAFSLAKAALSLAGFHPDYRSGRPPRTLRSLLESSGGGLEISLLSAVPKGSGLGTSSILAATLLGALNRSSGLGWDEVDLYRRVLGIEQLLTTGGGWQDQAGALFPSIKLIETSPGLAQTPSVRYLAPRLLGADAANRSLLLYYTGITRMAKGILKEIVRDMLLGRCGTLRTLDLIRGNALHLHRSMQEADREGLRRCLARSWDLNCRLDPGTTSPAIDRIIGTAGPDLAASKLLGAGGGGYMILCAADAAAGERIRARLEGDPPNARARFIDFAVSDRALEVTVS
jgi:galactokinase/mevalonate kinase-like predicted kinase